MKTLKTNHLRFNFFYDTEFKVILNRIGRYILNNLKICVCSEYLNWSRMCTFKYLQRLSCLIMQSPHFNYLLIHFKYSLNMKFVKVLGVKLSQACKLKYNFWGRTCFLFATKSSVNRTMSDRKEHSNIYLYLYLYIYICTYA